MANHLKIIGEAYEKFKDTNTSVSANKEPDSYRAMKRYFLSSEQKEQCKNIKNLLSQQFIQYYLYFSLQFLLIKLVLKK
jgi:hypothetical protein